MHLQSSYRRRGLTLLEVLVILFILLVVVGILVVAIPGWREKANRLQCANNLKEIGEAIYHFQGDVKHPFLPASRIGERHATWAVLILPFLPRAKGAPEPAFNWDLRKPYYDQPAEAREVQVKQYYCPSRRRPPQNSVSGDVPSDGVPDRQHHPGGLADYASSAGDGSPDHPWDTNKANGALTVPRLVKRQGDLILEWLGATELFARREGPKDEAKFKIQVQKSVAVPRGFFFFFFGAAVPLERGTSQTILVGEKHIPRGFFGDTEVGDGSVYNGNYPANFSRVGGKGYGLAQSPEDEFNRNFGSYHPDVCQFLMADGSVRPLTISVSETVLGELTARDEF
jgi:hypothetical protein